MALERLYVVERSGSPNCPDNLSGVRYSLSRNGVTQVLDRKWDAVKSGAASQELQALQNQGWAVTGSVQYGGCVNSGRFDTTRPTSEAIDQRQFSNEEEMRRHAVAAGEIPHQFGSAQEAAAYMSAAVNIRPASNTAGSCGCDVCPCPQPSTSTSYGNDVITLPFVPDVPVPSGGALPAPTVETVQQVQAFLMSPTGSILILAVLVWLIAGRAR